MLNYKKLRKALNNLTNENIGWIAITIKDIVKQNYTNHGFTPESNANWIALKEALEELNLL